MFKRPQRIIQDATNLDPLDSRNVARYRDTLILYAVLGDKIR